MVVSPEKPLKVPSYITMSIWTWFRLMIRPSADEASMSRHRMNCYEVSYTCRWAKFSYKFSITWSDFTVTIVDLHWTNAFWQRYFTQAFRKWGGERELSNLSGRRRGVNIDERWGPFMVAFWSASDWQASLFWTRWWGEMSFGGHHDHASWPYFCCSPQISVRRSPLSNIQNSSNLIFYVQSAWSWTSTFLYPTANSRL